VLVPGSGTFGMEAVARQFAGGKHVMVIRNGWFSYRWTQIFDMGASRVAHRAEGPQDRAGAQAPWDSRPIAEVVAAIRAEKPASWSLPRMWKPLPA
jgi:aspartate aminotransferase-like enzyme